MKTGFRVVQGMGFCSTRNRCIARSALVLALCLGAFATLPSSAKPRQPVPPRPESLLTRWHFDVTDSSGALRPTPLTQFNIALADGWSGFTLSMAGAEPRLLQYPLVEANGRTNLNLQTGSIRVWFQANWTSKAAGGDGPGAAARLIEIRQCTESVDALCVALYVTPDGDQLCFGLVAGGEPAGDWLKAPIAWQAGDWHLVTLTISPEASGAFLDGVRVADGSGLPAWLVAAVSKANVFSIGGDAGGENLAQGQFDELATFSYPLSDAEVKSYYEKLWPTVQLGPLTPEEEKAGEPAWVMPSGGSEQDSGGQYSEEISDYGCGLWLEITATNAVATLTLHNTRSNAGYQILTNSDLTTTNWSLFLTNVAGGSGYLTWTNLAINLSTNLFFRACEARDYVTNLVFIGLSYSNTVITPPDSMGAAGPNHFVELINNGIAVYDKSGGLITNMNSRDFFAIGTNRPSGAIDPRVLYDHQANRWLACAIDPFGSPQCILAVSDGDNPTNLLTGWRRHALATQRDGVDTDFTTLGFDSNGIYVGVAHRASGATNAGHTIVAIKKSDIYQNSPVTNFVYLEITNDIPVWTIQPAVSFDDVATNGYAWFLAKGPPDLGTNYQGGEILYRRLQWIGTNAVWADTNWLAVSTIATTYRDYYDLDGTNTIIRPTAGVVAPVSGGNISIYQTGSRLSTVTIRNGFVWTCQTAGLTGTNGLYSGDKSGTNVDRSAIQWFKLLIDSGGTTLTLSGHGRVFDSINQTNAWWYHFPSLAVNCPGDMVMGFSGSSATNYIGAFYTWRLNSGTRLTQPRLLQPGTVAYNPIQFGDYSATVSDPTDDWSFWTVQEYATPQGLHSHLWATVISRIRVGP